MAREQDTAWEEKVRDTELVLFPEDNGCTLDMEHAGLGKVGELLQGKIFFGLGVVPGWGERQDRERVVLVEETELPLEKVLVRC